jgi:hypothetical protein
MSTPIYGFPIPTLSTIADGPDAISDLAYRTERQMTNLRAVTSYGREAATALSNVSGVPVHTVNTALAVIGWVEIEVEIYLSSLVGAEAFVAGNIWLDANGTRLRTIRYHNQGVTRAVQKSFTGAMEVTAAVTNLTTAISVAADPTSSGHLYQASNISVRQYGAPSTG